MAQKPAAHQFHLSPEISALLVLPAALGILSAATALVCALIHWS